jgi:hypothetical protein
MYTSPIYTEQRIQFDVHCNFHRVIAKDDIQAGVILHIEHGIATTFNKLTWMVCSNDSLYDSLYPRERTHEELIYDEQQRLKRASEKVQNNCFINRNRYQSTMVKKDTATVLLSNLISAFNHSCCPNAAVHEYFCVMAGSKEVYTPVVFSVYPIHKGDEITIMYSAKIGHEIGANVGVGTSNPSTKLQALLSAIANL